MTTVQAADHQPPGIWQLAWPAIMLNLLHSLVSMVSIKMVASMGADAVAAVGIGNRFFIFNQAILTAITTGTVAMVARAWGSGDRREADRVVALSAAICLLAAAVMGALGYLGADRIAAEFGLEPAPARLAADFTRWLCLFNPFFGVAIALMAGLRAAGDTKTPLIVGGLMNVFNVALLITLVPRFGVRGAAIANGVAFFLASLVITLLWYRRRLAIRPARRQIFKGARTRLLFRIGFPTVIEQVAFNGGFVVFIWIITSTGTASLAAYNIGVQIMAFSWVVGMGFSIAASTLSGQHLGAGRRREATRAGWRVTALTIMAMSLMGLVFALFARPVAWLIIDDPAVVDLIVTFLYIFAIVQPFMAVEFGLAGALKGAGDTRFPLVVTFVALLGCRMIPAALFVSLDYPIAWIYGTLITDYVVRAIMLVWRYQTGRWQDVLPVRDEEVPEGALAPS